MNHYRIYHEEIPDFLLDYLRLPILERLKQVGMNCGCEYTSFPQFKILKPYSRYDHSLGVALIVWHFTRDKAQTVAGLLHDIATPVFAHVVDFMRGDYLKQEATEAGTETMIADSEALQALLKRDGLATADVCDYHRYPIADNHPVFPRTGWNTPSATASIMDCVPQMKQRIFIRTSSQALTRIMSLS